MSNDYGIFGDARALGLVTIPKIFPRQEPEKITIPKIFQSAGQKIIDISSRINPPKTIISLPNGGLLAQPAQATAAEPNYLMYGLVGVGVLGAAYLLFGRKKMRKNARRKYRVRYTAKPRRHRRPGKGHKIVKRR